MSGEKALTFATDISKHRYPGIARAALEMAYDNGGVNRDRPEQVSIDELDAVLAADGFDIAFDLQQISDWLLALPDDQLSTAVAGEHSDVAALMGRAPPGADELLNAIFDGPTP